MRLEAGGAQVFVIPYLLGSRQYAVLPNVDAEREGLARDGAVTLGAEPGKGLNGVESCVKRSYFDHLP